jgi:hypothetical protein
MKFTFYKYLLFTVSILVFLSGCSKKDICADLSSKAANKNYISSIENWVNERYGRDSFNGLSETPTEFLPGSYIVNDDKELFKYLDNDMEVSAILDSNNQVESIFFGKGSFRGLMVLLPGKTNTVVSASIAKPISERTFLVCIQRD